MAVLTAEETGGVDVFLTRDAGGGLRLVWVAPVWCMPGNGTVEASASLSAVSLHIRRRFGVPACSEPASRARRGRGRARAGGQGRGRCKLPGGASAEADPPEAAEHTSSEAMGEAGPSESRRARSRAGEPQSARDDAEAAESYTCDLHTMHGVQASRVFACWCFEPALQVWLHACAP